MVKKRPKQSSSASNIAKNYSSTPEELWKKSGSQFKYPNDNVGLAGDLSIENLGGFNSFCKKKRQMKDVANFDNAFKTITSRNSIMNQELQYDPKLTSSSANDYKEQSTSSKIVGSDESLSQSPCNSMLGADTKYVVPIGNRKRRFDAITEDKVIKDIQVYRTVITSDPNKNNRCSNNKSSINNSNKAKCPNSTIQTRQSSSKSSSSTTNLNSQSLIQQQQQLVLGPKGRYFEKVWEEQDFIEKYNLTNLPILWDWSQLINETSTSSSSSNNNNENQAVDDSNAIDTSLSSSKHIVDDSRQSNNNLQGSSVTSSSTSNSSSSATEGDKNNSLSDNNVNNSNNGTSNISNGNNDKNNDSNNTSSRSFTNNEKFSSSNGNGSNNDHYPKSLYELIHPSFASNYINASTTKSNDNHGDGSLNGCCNSNGSNSNGDITKKGINLAASDDEYISTMNSNSDESNNNNNCSSSSSSKVNNKKNITNKEVTSSNNIDQKDEYDEEDDEILYEFNENAYELEILETNNYLLLQKIQEQMCRENNMNILRDKRRLIEKGMFMIYNGLENELMGKFESFTGQKMTKSKRKRGQSEANTSTRSNGTNNSSSNNNSNNGANSQSSSSRQIGTRLFSSSSSSSSSSFSKFHSKNSNTAYPTSTASNQLLGASFITEIKHSSFLLSLKVGDLVEVMLDVNWTLGVIKKIQYENGGEGRLRYFKIQVYQSFVGDTSWVAVEDGRITPLGTKIPLPCFSLMQLPESEQKKIDLILQSQLQSQLPSNKKKKPSVPLNNNDNNNSNSNGSTNNFNNNNKSPEKSSVAIPIVTNGNAVNGDLVKKSTNSKVSSNNIINKVKNACNSNNNKNKKTADVSKNNKINYDSMSSSSNTSDIKMVENCSIANTSSSNISSRDNHILNSPNKVDFRSQRREILYFFSNSKSNSNSNIDSSNSSVNGVAMSNSIDITKDVNSSDAVPLNPTALSMKEMLPKQQQSQQQQQQQLLIQQQQQNQSTSNEQSNGLIVKQNNNNIAPISLLEDVFDSPDVCDIIAAESNMYVTIPPNYNNDNNISTTTRNASNFPNKSTALADLTVLTAPQCILNTTTTADAYLQTPAINTTDGLMSSTEIPNAQQSEIAFKQLQELLRPQSDTTAVALKQLEQQHRESVAAAAADALIEFNQRLEMNSIKSNNNTNNGIRIHHHNQDINTSTAEENNNNRNNNGSRTLNLMGRYALMKSKCANYYESKVS